MLPISARKALRAKIAGGKDEHSMFEDVGECSMLAQSGCVFLRG